MKTRPLSVTPTLLLALGLLGAFASDSGFGSALAQDSSASPQKPLVSPKALDAVSTPAVPAGGAAVTPKTTGTVTGTVNPEDFAGKTELDDPGTNEPRLVVPVDAEGKVTVPRLSKIDLDADLNYDGSFDNDSPSGQGNHEFVPPGLELGVGEVTRLLIRFKTYEEDFPGDLAVTLEVTAINRDSPSGTVAGNGEENVGRIRVWRDQARKELLLDSGDSSKRRFEWRYDKEKLSGGIPRTVYLEGVGVSPKFEGDLRLMVVANHVGEGGDFATPSSLYRSAFDHLLVTVRKEPLEKEFINNNVEGVWSGVGQASAESKAPKTQEASDENEAAQ